MESLSGMALTLPSAFTDAKEWIPSQAAVGIYADIFDSIDDTQAVYRGEPVTSQGQLGQIIASHDQAGGNVLLNIAIEEDSLQLLRMITTPEQYIDRAPLVRMVQLDRTHLVEWVIKHRKIREGTLKAAYRASIDFNRAHIFVLLTELVIPTIEDLIHTAARDRLRLAQWLIENWSLAKPERYTPEHMQRLLEEILANCARPDEAIKMLQRESFDLGDTSKVFDGIFSSKGPPSNRLLNAAFLLLEEATRLPAQVHLDKLLYFARTAEEADMLIERGANIRARFARRDTVLHNASRFGHIGVIRSVLTAVSRAIAASPMPNEMDLKRYIAFRNTKGLEALHVAKDMTTVITLLEWGASIDATGGSEGEHFSPLGLAIREKRDSAAIALLIRNANPNFPSDENMLEAALGNRMFGVVRLLLVHGADPQNLRRHLYFYPFHLESSSLLQMIARELPNLYPSLQSQDKARLRHYTDVKWPDLKLNTLFPPPPANEVAHLTFPDWDNDFPILDDRIAIPDYYESSSDGRSFSEDEDEDTGKFADVEMVA